MELSNDPILYLNMMLGFAVVVVISVFMFKSIINKRKVAKHFAQAKDVNSPQPGSGKVENPARANGEIRQNNSQDTINEPDQAISPQLDIEDDTKYKEYSDNLFKVAVDVNKQNSEVLMYEGDDSVEIVEQPVEVEKPVEIVQEEYKAEPLDEFVQEEQPKLEVYEVEEPKTNKEEDSKESSNKEEDNSRKSREENIPTRDSNIKVNDERHVRSDGEQSVHSARDVSRTSNIPGQRGERESKEKTSAEKEDIKEIKIQEEVKPQTLNRMYEDKQFDSFLTNPLTVWGEKLKKKINERGMKDGSK